MDSSGRVGTFTSLALDGSDRPHISYLYMGNDDLKYAHWNGSVWQIETVDSDGNVGSHTSLALDGSDRPHISYHDRSNLDLKYARVPPNRAPTAEAGGPYSVDEGGSVVLDASHTTDPEQAAATLSYAWDFDGDNQYDDATGINPTFSADDGPATITIGLQVTDDGDLVDTATAIVTVYNVAPTVTLNGPATVGEGEDATFTWTAADVPGDKITLIGGNCGAAGVDDDVFVNQLVNGSHVGGKVECTFPDGPATSTVSVVLGDEDGDEGGATFDVTIANVAPTITEVANSGPIDEGGSATVTVDASDPADPLTYAFDCDGDGDYEVGPLADNSATCGFADNGSYTVNVQVADDDGEEDTGSTTVTVNNVAPTAAAGAGQTALRNETVNLAGAWTDPAGSLDEPYDWSWDLDGDGTADSSGSAGYGDTINATTSFATEGSYTLTFSVTDKDDGSSSDMVVITVLNQAPDCSQAKPDQSSLWPPNHNFVSIDVLGMTDPDGDTVTITIDSIYQDEPVDSVDEDGELTVPDGQGLETGTAEVRAERDETGDGRVYHIGFTADDDHGGACEGEVLVGVPLSRKGTAVDGGALHDSTVAP